MDDFKEMFIKMLAQAAEDRAALHELMKVQGDRIAEQGDRIAEQGDRIAEQSDRIAELNEQAELDRALMRAQIKRIDEQGDRIAEQNKSIQEALRHLGSMKRNYGALVESFIGEGMVKLMDFPDRGEFRGVVHNFSFKFKDRSSDLDTCFLFSKAVVVVDAKATYEGKDFKKWQTELLPTLLVNKDFEALAKGRTIYVGLASLRFKRGLVEQASEAGYYAFKLLNDNARLMNGPGFEVRAVG